MTAPERTATRIPPLVEPAGPLSPRELGRYSRHLSLPGIGPEGQRRLRAAHVLVIGAGGLGAPVLQYLCAAGVGRLTVIDDDVVEASNLQRQVIHRTEDIGRPKAESARDALLRLDPEARVRAIHGRLNPENALELFAEHDLVLDGTDNFATRYLSNDASELTGTPLVWGTIFRFSGQASVFWPEHGPTLRDLFPDIPAADSVPSCAEGGVFGVLPGLVGSTMANEALKLICGIGEPLIGRLWRYDALAATAGELRFGRDPGREPVVDLEEATVACGVEAPKEPEEAGRIGSAEARALSERGRAVLVDVREPWELEIASIPSARSVPLGAIEADGWRALGDLPEDSAVVLLCKAGVRSDRARERLLRDARRDVRSLTGGIIAWQETVHGETLVY
ncbi:ThiF family adenylyltransferase [Gulosibacter sp. 10]|uniref:ThiF family adenylyltransferase n=1 Tax=Gulosibacter sp. 10 TaxID=1255570 RepID=UPI00097F49F8|nr:ThiF family adenylyltransferase [Gulosibacter sp. 10]SJM57524.1 Sulfur carrier protein adenylyltransferase ThiF [Gulosibacter sp. 10]